MAHFPLYYILVCISSFLLRKHTVLNINTVQNVWSEKYLFFLLYFHLLAIGNIVQYFLVYLVYFFPSEQTHNCVLISLSRIKESMLLLRDITLTFLYYFFHLTNTLDFTPYTVRAIPYSLYCCMVLHWMDVLWLIQPFLYEYIRLFNKNSQHWQFPFCTE